MQNYNLLAKKAMFNTLFFTIFSQNKVKIGLKSNNAENMQFRRIRECYFCRKNIDMLTSSANSYMRDVAENHKEYRYVCGRYAVGVPSWLLVWGCWAGAGAP